MPGSVAKPQERIDAFKAIGLTRSLRERAAERKQWGLPHGLSGGWVRGNSQSSRRGEGTGEHIAAPGSESSLGKGVAVRGWVTRQLPVALGIRGVWCYERWGPARTGAMEHRMGVRKQASFLRASVPLSLAAG